MGQLHELLAVEADRKKTAERLVSESIKTFHKENLFTGSVKRTEMFDDEATKIADEHLKLEATVGENLNYSLNALVKYWDTVAQKDATNANAKADVIVNGKVILKDVPGTTLLGMEKKLNELRNLFNSTPTLPPGIDWELDVSFEKIGVYKAKHDIETIKTQKDVEFREVSPATKEHPAQVAQVNVSKDIGKFITTKWSGMITPYSKAKMISNLEVLIGAFKKARQRANGETTVDIKIGKELIDFIMS